MQLVFNQFKFFSMFLNLKISYVFIAGQYISYIVLVFTQHMYSKVDFSNNTRQWTFPVSFIYNHSPFTLRFPINVFRKYPSVVIYIIKCVAPNNYVAIPPVLLVDTSPHFSMSL